MEKVRFLGASRYQVAWGGNDDPNPLLTVGKIYEVARKEVHSWHTKIELVGVPGKRFNDASFEPVGSEADGWTRRRNSGKIVGRKSRS